MEKFYPILANRGLALPWKNSIHFLKSKVFTPVICLSFVVWGTPGFRGSGFVKNLSPVGVEVCAKFGGLAVRT